MEPVTMDRGARRFSQIAELERQVGITEAREKKSTLLSDIRKAARDEGELPLFTFLGND